MAHTTPVSSQVYNSKDRIRNQITDKLREYLELENVDLTKSSFLSFIIDILSVNTSNLMFYQMSSYREFFLTTAQLPESIYNLAAFLGYSPSEATPATVDVLFTMPFGFQDANTQFTIPEGFQVKADDIIFSTYYETTITVTNNSTVSIVIQEGNRTYILPVETDVSNFYFILPFQQYTTQEQEFQISQDLQEYQFVSIDVPFDGQISEQTVTIQPPNSVSAELYTEVATLFLMDNTTKGYVARRTDNGLSLQFGNGLIGYQPEAGSTVYVTLKLTEGEDGNVIPGSITSGDRIYNTTSGGITQVVQYSITNASSASGGSEEESLEQIRQNAITNLTALERLVTENDFVNANTIIDGSPIGQNSLPVLKRSDLKINEIDLFSTIYFGTELVPTKNLFSTFTSTYIPRQTVISDSGTDYYTVFDIEIDPINSSASYTYIMYEIEQVPTLVTSYGSEYDLYADNLVVTRDGTQATFELRYQTTEPDSNLTYCVMTNSENSSSYTMANDGTAYVYTFTDNTIIPKGNVTYFFTIVHSTYGSIGQYSNQFVFRLSLSDFTISTALPNDATSYTVYDIPTIKASYYDSINQRDFELQTLQTLLTTMTFKDYKMLTDFINFKFANTTGTMSNMTLNDTALDDVVSFECTPPDTTSSNISFIVHNCSSSGAWVGHDDDIATSVWDGVNLTWTFVTPKSNQMVYVLSEDTKYIFTEFGWVNPVYAIPLQISLDIFISDDYSGTLTNLTSEIRSTLIDSFSDRFGLNAEIYRSEIINVVQGIDGVDYCKLLTPKSDIFFDYDIDQFTQEQLLEYTPEYIYFTEDDIEIRTF